MHPRRPRKRTLLPGLGNINTPAMHHDLLRFRAKGEDCIDSMVTAL
jgi:hypothetical protein